MSKRIVICSNDVIYDSIGKASLGMHVSKTALSRSIRGGKSECCGIPFKVLAISIHTVKNLDTGKTYESAIQASKEAGVHPDLIRKACRGERKRAGKMHWAYVYEEVPA